MRLRQALFWFRSHPSEGARGSPSGEQAHSGHKVWVLHLGECLLVDRFIVVRHARPLAQEGQKRPIEEAEIFNKELSLAGPCMVLHERGMRLHVLKLCLLEEMDELAGHPTLVFGKEAPCLEKGLHKESRERLYGRTAAGLSHIKFRDTDHPAGLAHSPIFLQEPGPLPSAQETGPKALVDQIEGVIRKVEPPKCVHGAKLHPITDSLGLGLFTRKRDHEGADVDPHKQGERGRGSGRFEKPPPGSTADIQDALKHRRVGLLGQDSPHPGREELVLKLEPMKLYFTPAILDKIGVGRLSLSI